MISLMNKKILIYFINCMLLILQIFLIKEMLSDETVRLLPQHTGTNPAFDTYINEYKMLAKANGVKLGSDIKVGFSKYNSHTLGVCWLNPLWREIDINPEEWVEMREYQKYSLLFHELTHCYCGRGHDTHSGIDYDAAGIDLVYLLNLIMDPTSQPGFLSDGCPASIMYPSSRYDDCFFKHYGWYTKEMFMGCKTW